MTASIIDGKLTRDKILEEIKNEGDLLTEKTGVKPGLVVVLVGEDPASKVYVGSKKRTCEKLGWYSDVIVMPDTSTQEEVEATVDRLNNDDKVHGILVQSPLPKGLDEMAIVERINPNKDVDGFHPVNVGRLALGLDAFVACTPKGVVELLKRYDLSPQGKRVVVAGRSHIVGTPLALLLSRKAEWGNATVTIVHSRTQDMPGVCREADILIAAIGRAEMITKEYVKPGAVVIDVGMNRVDDDTREKGYRLCGDVLYDEVKEIASAITPAPGGVGPMTIAMLMTNTLQAAKQFAGIE